MGILDDAIREHLELKRSHGASEEELRRKEAEAFGPVRQDAAPVVEAEHAPEPTFADALAAEPAVADEHTQLLSIEDEPVEPAPADPYAVHPGDDLVPDEQDAVSPAAAAGAGTLEPSSIETGPPTAPEHHDDEQHPALVDRDEIGREQHAPEPVFPRAETPSPPDAPLEPAPEDPYVGDPAVEDPEIDEPPPRQSAEHAHRAPDDGNAEDVLEETPEFLQDAPEHDRLWFEQRPPRDFDFGE